MVLVVNDSEPGEDSKLVVIDLAASRGGNTSTDYGPKDLRNRRALLDKAVPFDTWRIKQQKFLDGLGDNRYLATIDVDHNETRSVPVAVDPQLEQDIESAFLGWPRTDADISAEPRTARLALVGNRPPDNPDPATPENRQEPYTPSTRQRDSTPLDDPAADGRSGAVGSHAAGHAESPRANGLDRLDELDYRMIAGEMPSDDRQISDPALGAICREQGFDGLPTVAAAEDLDELIAAGGREFFRGVTVPWHVDNFRRGDYFPGRSMVTAMGNGTYVTTKREVALSFYADNRPNQLIRMVLHPGARITDEDHLRAAQRAQQESIAAELGRLVALRQTREIIAREEALLDRKAVLSDLGRLAAALGYDAYRTRGSLPRHNDEYWVVLNRTALMVEGDPAPIRPARVRQAHVPDLPPGRMAQIIAGGEAESPPDVAEPQLGAEEAAAEPGEQDRMSSAATISELTRAQRELVHPASVREAINQLEKRLNRLSEQEWEQLRGTAGQQRLDGLAAWVHDRLLLEDDLQRATAFTAADTPDAELNTSVAERRTRLSQELDRILGRTASNDESDSAGDGLERLAATTETATAAGRLVAVLADYRYRSEQQRGPMDSTVTDVEALVERPGVISELVTYSNGVRYIRETYDDAEHAVEEWAKALIGYAAIKAPIAEATLLAPEYNILYRKLRPDESSRDLRAADMLGIFQAVNGETSPFSSVFVRRIDGRIVWQDHHVGRQDIVAIGRRVAYLRDSPATALPEPLDGVVSKTFSNAMFGLRQLAEHADNPLHRAGLDIDTQTKSRMIAKFGLQHPYIELLGFESPYIPVAVIDEILGKLNELLARYAYAPGFRNLMTNIRRLRVDFLSGPRVQAQITGEFDVDGNSDTRSEISFNIRHLADRDAALAGAVSSAARGYRPVGSGRPYADNVAHEFAHAIDKATGWQLSEDLPSVMQESYVKLRERGLTETYEVWLGRLPQQAEAGDLEPLAVGFVDAENNGIVIGTPQWVIHEYVTQLRPPEIPPGLRVDLPAAVGGSAAFVGGLLQGPIDPSPMDAQPPDRPPTYYQLVERARQLAAEHPDVCELKPAAEYSSAGAEEWRAWATGLNDATARDLLDRYRTRATEHLEEFRRGEPPPIGEMLSAGRELNALVQDRIRRLLKAMPKLPQSRPAQEEMVALVHDAMARLSELEDLYAAAGAVVELVGALPAGPGTRWAAGEPGYTEFLQSLPSHLGRTTLALSELASAPTFDALWDEKLPTVFRHVADLSLYFRPEALPDGTDWSKQVDRYMAQGVHGDFDPALVSALRAVSADKASAARERAEPDDIFAPESPLRQLNTAAGYYLTRTRDVETALALLRRIDAALEPATERLGPSHPAVQAARAVRRLRTELADALAAEPDYAVAEIMRARGLSALGSESAEQSVIATAARSLGWRHPIGAMPELGEQVSAELYRAATTRIERSDVELSRLATARGMEPSRLSPGSPELVERVAEFDSTAQELVDLIADAATPGTETPSEESKEPHRDRNRLRQSVTELILSRPSGPQRLTRVMDRLERGLRLVDRDAWRGLTGDSGAARLRRLPGWIARGVLLDADMHADDSADPARQAELNLRRSAHEAELADLLGLAAPVPESGRDHPAWSDPLAESRLLGESVPRSAAIGRVIDAAIRYLEAGQLVGIPGRLIGDGMEVARLRGEEIRRELLEIESGRNRQWHRRAELELEHAQCRERYQRLLLQLAAAPFGIDVAHCAPTELMRRIERLRTETRRPTRGLAELIAVYDDHVAALADVEALSVGSDATSSGSPKSAARQEVSNTAGVDELLDMLDVMTPERRRRARWAELCGVPPAEVRSAIAGLRREFADLGRILVSELVRTEVVPRGTPLNRGWVQRADAAWESEQRLTPEGPLVRARHNELRRWRDRARRYRMLSHLLDSVEECERLDREYVARSGRFRSVRNSAVVRPEARSRAGWIPVGDARVLAPDDHPGARDRGRRIAAAADRRRRAYDAAVRGAALIGVEHPDQLRVEQLREAVERMVDWSDDFRDPSNPHRSKEDRAHAAHVVDVGATTVAYAILCSYAQAEERAARTEAARDTARELLQREVVDRQGGRFLAWCVAVVEKDSAPPEVFVAAPAAGLDDALAALDSDDRDDLTSRAARFHYEQIVVDENGRAYAHQVHPTEVSGNQPDAPERTGHEVAEIVTATKTSPPATSASQPDGSEESVVGLPDRVIRDTARAEVDRQLRKWRDAGLHGERITDQVAFLPGADGGTLVVVASRDRHRRALLDAAATDSKFAGALWRPKFEKRYLEVFAGPRGPAVMKVSSARAEGPYRHPTVPEIEGILLDEYRRFRRLGLIELGFADWLAGLGDHVFDARAATGEGQADAARGRLKQDGTLSTFGLAVAAAKSTVDSDLPHPTAVLVRAVTRQFPLPGPAVEDDLDGGGLVLRATIDLGGICPTVELRDNGDGWRIAPPSGRAHASDGLSRWFRGMTDLDPNRLLRRIQQAVGAESESAAPQPVWQLSIPRVVGGLVDIRRENDEWRVYPGNGSLAASLSDTRDSDLTRLAWRVTQRAEADAVYGEMSGKIEIPLSQEDGKRYLELRAAADEAAAKVRRWRAENAAHLEMDSRERLGESVAADREALADEWGIEPLGLESIPLVGDPAARRADILRRESDLRALAELAGRRLALAATMSRAIRACDGFITGPVVAAILENRGGGGRKLADGVGYEPDASGGVLIVAAPAGGHVRALSELAATDSKFAGALWRDDLEKLYLRVTKSDRRIEATVITADEAEGPNREHNGDEVRRHLLDHFLTYRAAGAVDLGFRSWLEQLGPEAFDGVTHRTLAEPRYLLWWGSRMMRSGAQLPQFHPARVLHRLHTRQIPVPSQPMPGSEGQASRVASRKVTLGPTTAVVSLEQHEGRWRVASNDRSWAGAVLAQHFPDLAADSDLELIARIAALVTESAASDMHHTVSTKAPKTCFVTAARAATEGPGPRPRIDIPEDLGEIPLEGVKGRDAARWAGANWRAFENPEAIVAHVRRTGGTVVGAVGYRSFDPNEAENVGAHAFTVKMVGAVVVVEEQVSLLDDGRVVTDKRTVRGDAAVDVWVAHLSATAGEGATFHGLAFKANGKPEHPLRPTDEPVGLPGLEFPLSPLGERPPGREPPETGPVPADEDLFPDISRVLDRLPSRPRRYHELVARARQLAAEHPDVCELRPVLDEDGAPISTRRGIPMEQFVVHPYSGSKAAPHVYWGLIHSNEYWSSGTIEGLMDYAVTEPGARTRKRVFLLGLDPDGAMLAEGFAGLSPLPYEWAIRTFYRQTGDEQPEWTFGSVPEMPETRALMAMIREQPEMLFSLHNLDIGFPWVGTTREVPGLADTVAAAGRLSRMTGAEPIYDMPGARVIATGVLEIPEDLVWHKIADYARRQGATLPTVVVIEAPMWQAGRFPELPLAEAADIVERRLAPLDDLAAKLPVAPSSNVYRSARSFIDIGRWFVEHWRAEPEMPNHPIWSRVIVLRAAGLLWQYANELLDTDPADTVYGAVERELDRLLRSWVREFEDTYEITPGSYRDTVAYQMRVCLAAVGSTHLDTVAPRKTGPTSELAGHLVARRDDVLSRAQDARAWLAQQIAVTAKLRDWVEVAIRRSAQELEVGRAEDPPWLQRGNLADQARELRHRVAALGSAAPDDLVARSARFAKALADIDHRQRLIARAADLGKQYGVIGDLIIELGQVSGERRFGELDTTVRNLVADLERRRTAIEEEISPESHGVATSPPGARPDLMGVLPVDHGVTGKQERRADAALRAGKFAGAGKLRLPQTAEMLSRTGELATARASWWQGLAERPLPERRLSPVQEALIQRYPHQVGNAEGLPVWVRDMANRLSITRDLEAFVARRPEGRGFRWLRTVLSEDERRQFDNLIHTRNHLAYMESEARKLPDRPPVQVLSYDAAAYGGKGRAVVVLGDGDSARSVSWHVPGTTTTVRSLADQFKGARNHYVETRRADPALSVAAVVWIGYDAPTGPLKTGFVKAASPRRARIAHEGFLRDLLAFDAMRAFADPDNLPCNHVRPHSYGCVLVCLALGTGQLAGHVDSVVLFGSPGMPSTTVADSGIPAENYYAASSWRDDVTLWGGDQPESMSRYVDRLARILGLGHGVDPAGIADIRRIAAEFPDTEAFASGADVHRGYLAYTGPGRPTESLAQSTRIAAGQGHTIVPVEHRRAAPEQSLVRRSVGTRPLDPEQGRYDDGTSDTRAPGPEAGKNPSTPWARRKARFLVTGPDNAGVALDRSPDLMSLARTHADEVIRESEIFGLRPQSVSSVVYDRRTGEVFFGENNTHYVGDPPDMKIRMGAPKPFHPLLEERTPTESLEEWPAANCAETHAANKALWNASLPESLSIHKRSEPPALSDFAYSTIRTMTGKPYPSCRYCQVFLGGATEVLTPGPQEGLFIGEGAGDALRVTASPPRSLPFDQVAGGSTGLQRALDTIRAITDPDAATSQIAQIRSRGSSPTHAQRAADGFFREIADWELLEQKLSTEPPGTVCAVVHWSSDTEASPMDLSRSAGTAVLSRGPGPAELVLYNTRGDVESSYTYGRRPADVAIPPGGNRLGVIEYDPSGEVVPLSGPAVVPPLPAAPADRRPAPSSPWTPELYTPERKLLIPRVPEGFRAENLVKFALASSVSENGVPDAKTALKVLRSNPEIMREYLGMILLDDDILTRISNRSYIHDNGFFKIVIEGHSGLGRLRLHGYDKERHAAENPHSHMWNFASEVMSGDLEEIMYKQVSGSPVDPSEGPYTRRVFRGGPGAGAPDESGVRLAPVEKVVHKPGEIYTRWPTDIHSVSPRTRRVVTLFLQSEDLVESTQVYTLGSREMRTRRAESAPLGPRDIESHIEELREIMKP
ncbi:alpha/beta hydrolase [Nocardia wallacei]|uniref:alpha/beta hydrolase n=1 Tax=Nocardia wallacei TaxID=480035 RepID=UPI0024581C52|nr:alpha/beta hydrolase [Nocardia wallacei]